MDILNLRTGITPTITVPNHLDPRPNPTHFSAGRPPATALRTALSTFSFKHPFRWSLFPMKGVALDDAVSVVEHKESKNRGGGNLEEFEGQNGNWVMKVLHVKSMWSDKGTRGEEENGSLALSGSGSGSTSCGESEVCDCEYEEEEEEEEVGFDRSSFSKLLKKVSLGEAKLYAQMSHLGSLAYDIPKIKSGNLLKRHGFKFVTSSIEKREQLANTDSDQPSSEAEEQETGPTKAGEPEDAENEGPRVSPEAAFQTVASAAAFLNARTRSIFVSSKADADQETLEDDKDSIGDMASFIATTDSVTSVVAAKEEVKQAVADDLNSISSSPCEWYICDDDKTATRFFVIQGSETLASWQANLLFEPIQFEGMDIMVHRGIYEAAKGMYQQMLPEIRAHTRAHGARARLRFTGHSLGGSLSLLINLMLLIRGEAPLSSLLPVITFGSPTILCGGDEMLRKLGLPRSHVQAVTMHRDIVPRAFSCHYPNHVAEILKAVNGNFRNHRCLNNLKLLYAPMGEMIILQPEATYSPQHHLLPSGRGLYAFTNDADRRLLRSAKLAFLNSPHPLEILSDRSAYGNTGTIQRDHDMSSYLKCVRSVIRHELFQLGRAERERRRDMWRSLILPRVVQGGGVAVGAGRATVKRCSRLVASHHVHLLVLVGGYSVLDSFLF